MTQGVANASDPKPESLGTVQRVLAILRLFAEHGELSLKQVSLSIGLPVSTCHRLLDLLAREDVLGRLSDRKGYSIGPDLFRLAALIHERSDIRDLAAPFLREVASESNETCVLCLYLPGSGEMIFAEKVDANRLLRYQLPMNVPMPLLWGASGRAVLAHLSEAEVDQIYKRSGIAPASGEMLPSRADLGTELKKIRERGYAVSRGQKIAGAVGITAPVFGAGDRVVGSFGITAPEERVSLAAIPTLGELVKKKSEELSRSLGAKLAVSG